MHTEDNNQRSSTTSDIHRVEVRAQQVISPPCYHTVRIAPHRTMKQAEFYGSRKSQHYSVAEFIDHSPVLKAFFAGSLSGTFSTVLFQPLDLVKTRLQNAQVSTPSGSYGAGRLGPSPGMFHLVTNILKKEQFTGLWKGFTPSITRTVPGVGMYFSSMHWMTVKFTDGSPTPLQAVCIGLIGRTLSASCLIPITVVKTRFESGTYQYKGIADALKMIYTREGFRGLTCGLLPTIVRDAPFSGIYLMFYTQTRKLVPQELMKSNLQLPVQFSCGVVAGILASVITQPADVIKTKMQLYPQLYPNFKTVIFHLHQKYGFKGYFRGLVPRMLRRTLMAAMAWTVYEQITRSMGLK